MACRVVLIDPGQSVGEGGTRHTTRQTPHIGLCCLAMSLRGHVDVHLLDMPLTGMSLDDLDSQILKLGQVDVVGITAATFNSGEAVEVAELVRRKLPHALVLVGGPHVNAFPSDLLDRSSAIDAAIVGEGEKLLLHISLEHKNPDFNWNLPGIVRRDTPYQPPAPAYQIQNMDDLPWPDWEFLNLPRYSKRYSSRFDRMEQLAPLSTVRGCPRAVQR